MHLGSVPLGTFRHLGIAVLGQVTPNWPEIESVLPKLTGPPIRKDFSHPLEDLPAKLHAIPHYRC